MMMPSLFNQLVPSVSSSADTFLMRCAKVGFAAEGRKGWAGDGRAILAEAGSFTVSFAACAGGGGGAGGCAGGNFVWTGIICGSRGGGVGTAVAVEGAGDRGTTGAGGAS